MNRKDEQPRRRHSRQRQAVYETVRSAHCHPTADDVFEAVRESVPRISLGTVYRNLEILAEDGAIQRIDVAGGQRRYDRTTGNHCHIRCERCGRVEDIEGADWILKMDSADLHTDFDVTGIQVSFNGLCPQCRET